MHSQALPDVFKPEIQDPEESFLSFTFHQHHLEGRLDAAVWDLLCIRRYLDFQLKSFRVLLLSQSTDADHLKLWTLKEYSMPF